MYISLSACRCRGNYQVIMFSLGRGLINAVFWWFRSYLCHETNDKRGRHCSLERVRTKLCSPHPDVRLHNLIFLCHASHLPQHLLLTHRCRERAFQNKHIFFADGLRLVFDIFGIFFLTVMSGMFDSLLTDSALWRPDPTLSSRLFLIPSGTTASMNSSKLCAYGDRPRENTAEMVNVTPQRRPVANFAVESKRDVGLPCSRPQ